MNYSAKNKVVYLCAPYRDKTVNGIYRNIQAAREAALYLWEEGYYVICPHMNTALFDGALPDEVWLAGYIEIMKRCDLVFFLRGWEHSSGCKNELQICKQNNIPFMELNECDGSYWESDIDECGA
jgi:hypothetical protein